ncbi:MAG: hypothetical protein KDI61_11925 [Alphaproteobacteria bacterium]|nr:hypothetical protein [Alphaproteobacteria bacterium]MCB1840949.1 hypothetical protein [Alphaproteobacteria bacterium]
MKKPLLLIVFQFLFLTGCATNYYVNEDYYTQPKNYEKISVYVTNPDHEAYEVLKKSEIYDLTEDSACPNKLEIQTLGPAYHRCGLYALGVLAQAFTLGTLPLSDTEEEIIAYSISNNGKTVSYKHDLKYKSRSSIWEIPLLPLTYTQNGARTKTLSLSQREICENPSCTGEIWDLDLEGPEQP